MHGQQIAAGDKVVMWYVSGNRDPRVVEQAHQFKIDRPRARQHLAFGYGIHCCMGNRSQRCNCVCCGRMLKRFEFVEVVATPERSYSTFIRGFKRLEVRLHLASLRNEEPMKEEGVKHGHSMSGLTREGPNDSPLPPGSALPNSIRCRGCL